MNLETLLTSSTGFGLETASFLQRAVCRITDGQPLDDLLERATDHERGVLEKAIGCDPSQLPTGAPPVEVLDLEPVRCGKSLREAARAVARTQTVDVSIIKAGQEGPRLSLLATSTDNANALRGHLNTVFEKPALRSLVIGDTAESVTLRHPSGLPVEIKVIAAHRGGYSLASRWSAGCTFDEAPGWQSTDRVISLEESRDMALGRLLPGAQSVYVGSPWQPAGYCYEAFKERFGKPDGDMVVIKAGPAWELNSAYWTPERVARIKRTSPRTYAMHLLAEFGSAANSAFDYEDVLQACAPREIPEYMHPGVVFCAVDPSSLAGDAWAWAFCRWRSPPLHRITRMLDAVDEQGNVIHRGAVVARDDDGNMIFEKITTEPILEVLLHGAWEGEQLANVTVDEIVSALVSQARAFNCTTFVSDQREQAALTSMFLNRGVSFTAFPWSNESKDAAVTTLRRLLKEHRLVIREPNTSMRQQMLAFGYKLTAGGKFTYAGRHGHDDRVATLITAAHAINAGREERHPREIVSGR